MPDGHEFGESGRFSRGRRCRGHFTYNAGMLDNPDAPKAAQPGPQGEGGDVTRLLNAAAAGDASAPNAAFELIYDCLRGIARQRMAGERSNHTLQATALVHEAYVRLLGKPDAQWAGRGHFYRAAAEAMRKILIDHARAKNADKRGGGRAALSIVGIAAITSDAEAAGLLALDEAISRLEGVDRQAAEVVRLRFYSGLDGPAVAEALGISERTVRRDWSFARGWLRDALERDDA